MDVGKHFSFLVIKYLLLFIWVFLVLVVVPGI